MRALIVVDMQYDFIHGALAVPRAVELVPIINKLALEYDNVILTQDWHPVNHSSFKVNSPDGPWPVHCIQDSMGAAFYGIDVAVGKARAIIRKGMDPQFDSYSGFEDDNGASTGLGGLLQDLDVGDVHVCGLARNFCVEATYRDALRYFKASVIEDACRAV